MEVYNWNVDGSSGDAEAAWDYVLTHPTVRKIWATAVDDYHWDWLSNGDKGWVIVFASSLTLDAIKKSLEEGNFYGSNGADLAITVLGASIIATTSANSTIVFKKENGIIVKIVSDAITAAYVVTGSEKYVRVVVTRNSDGEKAWAQPIFVSKYR